MNDKFKNMFLTKLNEDDSSGAPALPEGDMDQAFKDSLDDGTDEKDFDTEGVASLVDALTSELQSDVEKLGKVVKYLVDPANPNCMLKRLEKVHKSIEFEKLFQPIEKAVEKTAEALSIAIAKINVATTTAGGKRDRRKAEDIAKLSQSTDAY